MHRLPNALSDAIVGIRFHRIDDIESRLGL
jgi:hypothetical protein